ncbi:MAG: hypothetical protein A2086_02850 [Spirochaetes bacterium GWD1_27_9]|nr:MAG: hypothetical protein A2Y34_17150 [Spirochaetes bacterium GWC1_27_15]OHD31390.1 MAG: hypothetical protein A2086_02850 [Spirochaetes bacterium GWD1_27_9]
MFKKITGIILIVLVLNSCLTIKIGKDSEPLVDFGTPIIGHFRNGDKAKGILYTALFLTSLVAFVLFTPIDTKKCVIQIDRTYSDWVLLGTGIGAGTSLVASSIDTAVTYQIANQKIIDLNNIKWQYDPTGKNPKYLAIQNFREEQYRLKEEQSDLSRLEGYKGEIEFYRKKLVNGTITDDELAFLEKAEKIKEVLKNELGFYYINREKFKQGKNIDDIKIEYYRQRLIEETISEDELKDIDSNESLKEILKNELGYYNIVKKKKQKK